MLLSRISWIGAAAVSGVTDKNPGHVRNMLWASCLTLYRAYRLDTHPTWYDYVRERRGMPNVICRLFNKPRDARRRLALLWDPPPR